MYEQEKPLNIPKEILNITALLSSPILTTYNIKPICQVKFNYGYNNTKQGLYNYCYSYLIRIHEGFDIFPMEGFKFRSIVIDGANVCAKVINEKSYNFFDKNLTTVYDCSLLNEVYLYFKKKNVHDIVIVLNSVTKKGNEYFLRNKKLFNYSCLENLIKLNVILISNEKYYQSEKWGVIKQRTYDDVVILQLAAHKSKKKIK